MIHCRSSVEKCSACCADGRAIFTIVTSSTIMSCATPKRVRTAHLLAGPRLRVGEEAVALVAALLICSPSYRSNPPFPWLICVGCDCFLTWTRQCGAADAA